ncbi:MAG: 2,3-bisphosphoglycerate-independent phosphoglycerate mutase [Leptolyngbyaceae bacterium]|nr:2,3-bisphosphoglycerate-independent phosphoglycerate mutase [Leptolyngbyaceae bacterium]
MPAETTTQHLSHVWEDLAWNQGGKIVYLVLDGVGGLSHPDRSGTELQVAKTPHMDALTKESSCGLLEIVGPGITPGSGPGHLALFGYDPLKYRIGRGILSALGIDFDLQVGDIATRVNFATVDDEGTVQDRRAGRISTELNQKLCQKINEHVALDFDGTFFFETVSEHRAVFVLRGQQQDGQSNSQSNSQSGQFLGGEVTDTDPQHTGVKPNPPKAQDESSQQTALLLQSFLRQVSEVLADESPANMVLLRGVERYEPLPSLKERFKLRGLCIADYPMYRGVSRLIGMDVMDAPGGMRKRFESLKTVYDQDYDFYFLHVKKTDSLGEDANFDHKVALIEEVDSMLPSILDLDPDVLVITADHSTPAVMGRHSWHSVPVLLKSKYVRIDPVESFDEYACLYGSLGERPGCQLMGLALAHAGRLRKFGA